MEHARPDDARYTVGRDVIPLTEIAKHSGRTVPEVRQVLQAQIDQGAFNSTIASHDGYLVLVRPDDRPLRDFLLELRDAVEHM